MEVHRLNKIIRRTNDEIKEEKVAAKKACDDYLALDLRIRHIILQTADTSLVQALIPLHPARDYHYQ